MPGPGDPGHKEAMSIVHFIGAGPGDPDLITVKGRRLIEEAPVVLYAGSLVPRGIVDCARKDARVIDTAALNLDEIITEMKAAYDKGQDVARVHSGDPSIYGAIGEQMRRLDALGISYDIIPGVPAFAAAAALLKSELTLPGVSQSIILTRVQGASSPMPPGEDLATLGKAGATLALHLSVKSIAKVVRELTPHYGADCPVVVVYRASWPDESVMRGRLDDIEGKLAGTDIARTALIFVGRVFGAAQFKDSQLYNVAHQHLYRPE